MKSKVIVPWVFQQWKCLSPADTLNCCTGKLTHLHQETEQRQKADWQKDIPVPLINAKIYLKLIWPRCVLELWCFWCQTTKFKSIKIFRNTETEYHSLVTTVRSAAHKLTCCRDTTPQKAKAKNIQELKLITVNVLVASKSSNQAEKVAEVL